MRQGLNNTHRLEQSVGLRVDPKVVLGSQILQLTQAELEQTIEAELAENPALERLENDQEPLSDEQILKTVAPQELKMHKDDYEYRRSSSNDDDNLSWVELTPAGTSLWDHLRAQLFPVLPRELHRIAEYAIECVNEKGYLTSAIEEIALETGTALEIAELVVQRLQACEPPGIGALNLQQCLLLQLRYPEKIESKIARVIVQRHMDEFIARRTHRLTRKFKVMPEIIEAAFDEILALTPYPGEAFDNQHGYARFARSSGVTPDLVINRSEQGWSVEVKGPNPGSFGLNYEYRKRFQHLNELERAPKDEKRHVNTYVNRAKDFISCLDQRRRTLKLIGEHLIHRQGSFV